MDVSLLRAADQINKSRIDRVLRTLQRELWILKHKRIAILGLSYKPNTDDVRFSPAVELAGRLVELGAEVQAYDPQAMEKARRVLPNITYCDSAYDAAAGAQALVIATEWECFHGLDWRRVAELMTRPLLIDGRNLLDAAEMAALGFQYHSVGRLCKSLAIPA